MHPEKIWVAQSPLWNLGFRPFFLLGSILAATFMALWLTFLSGLLRYTGFLPLPVWHAHEMIYGFTSAIIAGFVLTAIQNWSGMRGVHGRKLQGIVAVWLAARVLMLAVHRPHWMVSVVDLSFYPLLGICIVPHLRDLELKLERVLLVFFSLLFFGNLLVHSEALGWISGYSRRGNLLGLYTAILLIVFMGGRVIPFFTESSIARAQPKKNPGVEAFSHLLTVCFLLSQFFLESTVWAAAVSFLTAGIHLARLAGWYVRRIRRVPIIWILHLGYFSMVLGFLLSGFSNLGWVPAPLAIHAFTVGGLGMVIYGMMTRVSLGHTGRRLIPPKAVVIGYWLLACATVIRVFGPWITVALNSVWIQISGILWIAAFVLFFISYGRILIQPRH